MNYEITQEQIKKLSRQDQIVEEYLNEWFPEAFEELEIDKWYKHIDKDGRVYLFNHQGSNSYGFFRGNWTEKWDTLSGFDRKPILANDSEVTEMLIKESKKRGFINGAYANNSMIEFNGCTPSVSKKCKINLSKGFSNFEKFYDLRINGSTPCNSAFIIFKNGVWAEVLKTKYLTKEQAENSLKLLHADGYEYEIID